MRCDDCPCSRGMEVNLHLWPESLSGAARPELLIQPQVRLILTEVVFCVLNAALDGEELDPIQDLLRAVEHKMTGQRMDKPDTLAWIIGLRRSEGH
jgi:hypothetical protein